jgi:hypothetical protein
MEDKKMLNEVSMDAQGNEMKYGDKNYFEAVQRLKEESWSEFVFESDYSAMFMTF